MRLSVSFSCWEFWATFALFSTLWAYLIGRAGPFWAQMDAGRAALCDAIKSALNSLFRRNLLSAYGQLLYVIFVKK
jgi:hypothetical protein